MIIIIDMWEFNEKYSYEDRDKIRRVLHCFVLEEVLLGIASKINICEKLGHHLKNWF